MAVATQTQSGSETKKKASSGSTFLRIARFTALRVLSLSVTVVIAIYLTILIANMGGYVDTIIKSEIEETITMSAAANPQMRAMAPDVRAKLIKDRIAAEEQRQGLNTPVAVRNVSYLRDALTLNLGHAINMSSDSGSKEVQVDRLGTFAGYIVVDGYIRAFSLLYQPFLSNFFVQKLWQFLG